MSDLNTIYPLLTGVMDRQKKKLNYNRKWIQAKRRKLKEQSRAATYVDVEGSDITDDEIPQLESRLSLSDVDCNVDMSDGEARVCERNGVIYSPQVDRIYSEALFNEGTEIREENSDEDITENSSENLSEDLKSWVEEFQIKANAVDGLLKILRKNGHPDLPATSRTLLQTPQNVSTKTVSGMDYFHFGLEGMLTKTLKRLEIESLNTEELELEIGIDGLPLFNSTNTSAWPVLCCISNVKPQTVFPVAIAVGGSKPLNNDFLQESVDNLKTLIDDGLTYENRQLKISVKTIICDAPARAMVKCTKNFSGYYGCDKCTQKGYYSGRIIYPSFEAITARTDDSFRRQAQPEHHSGLSPFLQLPIDMVNAFPIDYMHQTCLGVMRKLLNIWLKGPLGPNKLSPSQRYQVSEALLSIRKFIPREFARRPRSLDAIDRWKATEFRQFLLYTGKYVLRWVLPDVAYRHFLTFSVAICILVNEKLAKEHGEYAHQLLLHFVSKAAELYTKEFLVYNVHTLVHLYDQTKRYGYLDNCSAWKFENYLKNLKTKVRSGNNPAVQIVKRIYEGSNTREKKKSQPEINLNWPHNIYRTAAGSFCEVLQVHSKKDTTYVCWVYHSLKPTFEDPCDSRIIEVCKGKRKDSALQVMEGTSLRDRCMVIEDDSGIQFYPLLHEYEGTCKPKVLLVTSDVTRGP